MLPQDIIDNTRRAFSTSATTATGYSDLGAPEGRYFAPANSDGCTQLYSGQCAPRTLLVRAPWFTRFDMSVRKRFATGNRMSYEIQFDILNVFDNINFNPVANPGTGRRSSRPAAPTRTRATRSIRADGWGSCRCA